MINVPSYYVAQASERLASRGGWPSTEVAEVIEDYDPEQDVVFIFLRLDGDVFHYNVTDELDAACGLRIKAQQACAPLMLCATHLNSIPQLRQRFGSLISKKNNERKQVGKARIIASSIAHTGVEPFVTLIEPQRGHNTCAQLYCGGGA